MPKSNTTCNDILKLVFNGTALPWAANTNLYIALHTASPGVSGNQATNEVAYDGYARVAVLRTTAGFTASTASSTSNVEDIEFPQNTGTLVTVTHFSIGTLSTGAGQILYFNIITDEPIEIDTSIIPKILASNLVVTEE